ncbi:MAG: MFS transporter [Fidelibacterota bacterium]
MEEHTQQPKSQEVLEEEASRARNTLNVSIKEGNWWAIMVGFGESYLTAFGEYLKASLTQISLLTTLPQVISSLVQLAAFKMTNLMATRKRLVVTAAMMQSVTWLAIIVITYFVRDVTPLLGLAVFYFVCGAMGVSPWMSWMGDLVPEKSRGRYFGRRNRIVGFVSFVSVTAAGMILDRLSSVNPFSGFAVLFSIAFIGRFISSLMLANQYEPQVELKAPESYSFLRFLRRLHREDYGFFSLYIMLMMFAVYLASPLFIVLWLRVFEFSYMKFMILVSSASIASFITMTVWGKSADRFGNKSVLEVCSYLLTFVPLLWFPLGYLPREITFVLGIGIQILSGFSWAGFNLSSGNFVYDMVTPENRLKFISYHTALKGSSIFLGGIVGAFVAGIPVSVAWLPSGIYLILLISGAARGLVALTFVGRIREAREVVRRPPLLRMVTVVPVQGLYLEIVVGMNRTARKFRQGMRRIWNQTSARG